MRKLKAFLIILSVVLSAAGVAQAQTTASIAGKVTDRQGASVAGATVELIDPSTNQARTQETASDGHYLFPSVPPGLYKITVTKQGFRQSVISSLKVDVGKSHTADVALEIGEVSAVVEVTTAGVELQKLDATVGNVIGGDALKLMPSLSRDATALILLQPMVTPRSNDEGTGGQVAGARSDQNTFQIDGGDATSNTEGNGAYNTGFVGEPRAVVPTPTESLEEFRVATNNQNAAFGRSAGGQVNMVTKRGTNELHGSAYWYHQNDNLNANSWSRNRLGQKDPELKDNRYGFTLGGPIIKDKTFIFGHYEGRRFPQTGERARLVPTESLRQGILRFRDAAGNIVSYNLATSTQCAGGTCDPRSVGISPVIRSIYNLMPAGNDTSLGDGLNTIGFRTNVPFTLKEEFVVGRLDHNISSKWQFITSYRYGHTDVASLAQIDITKSQATATRPLEPRYLLLGLTGMITPQITNDFRFNFLRHWWEWGTAKASPQVAGTAAAVAIAGERVSSGNFPDEPINIDTQNARTRLWNGRDYTFQDNVSWVKGNHTIQFGGKYMHQNFLHVRDDRVIGALSSPVYQADDGSFITIPSAFRPPSCGGGITANCLQSGDTTRWNRLYAGSLGMIDRATALLTRNAQLQPNPPGTPLRESVKVKAFELYANDTWRISPSLTFSYGLTYNVQMPPLEEEGKQTLMVTGANNEILDARTYLDRRREAALRGEVYNPDIGFLPVGELGRKYPYDPDWNNFGPRLALAWSPSAQDGFLGRVFGKGKSVLRGGYSVSYDRVNGVGIVMIPILGVGYGITTTCRAPNTANVCAGTTDPSSAFRIGVDGSSVNLAPLPTATLPIQPAINSPFEFLSFQIDPKRKVGSSQTWDVTFQRELPGNMVLEVGYVGRWSKNLYQGLELNQVPFFMKDKVSGQTFAQAYDSVAAAIRTGAAVTPQPFFENSVRGSAYCAAPFASCTAGLVDAFSSEFENGLVFDLVSGISSDFVFGPMVNEQILSNYLISDLGRSDYNAGFLSLQKRFTRGLTFGLNYTLARSRDQGGYNQNTLNAASNAFDLDYDYGPSIWDRRHTFNGYWHYELPFGPGRRFSTNSWADKLFGGWHVSGIFTAASGLPIDFLQGTCQEFGQGGIFGNCSAMVPTGGGIRSSVNPGVTGSNGIGTAAGGSGAGLNAFANPEEVYNSFRRIRLSEDNNRQRGAIRGLPSWHLDLSIGKLTRITERVGLRFTADFTNVFNRVQFADPGFDFTDPAAFGVLATQLNRPRFIQVGARLEF